MRMMLTICKGRSSQHCVLAGDSEGLEVRRQLTKMRTRFWQLTSILSHGDTTGRIIAWEPEIVTYERDSGKILDGEIKVGAGLLRLPESQLKTQSRSRKGFTGQPESPNVHI